jgi:hypothetical protein
MMTTQAVLSGDTLTLQIMTQAASRSTQAASASTLAAGPQLSLRLGALPVPPGKCRFAELALGVSDCPSLPRYSDAQRSADQFTADTGTWR